MPLLTWVPKPSIPIIASDDTIPTTVVSSGSNRGLTRVRSRSFTDLNNVRKEIDEEKKKEGAKTKRTETARTRKKGKNQRCLHS